MNTTFPKLIKASDPEQLTLAVENGIANGLDLYAGMFATEDGILCQWMARGICLYEYRLVNASDEEDLEAQVHALCAMGFDLMFNLVHWNGRYLQWMQRMKESSLSFQEQELVEAIDEELNGSLDVDTRIALQVRKLNRTLNRLERNNAKAKANYCHRDVMTNPDDSCRRRDQGQLEAALVSGGGRAFVMPSAYNHTGLLS